MLFGSEKLALVSLCMAIAVGCFCQSTKHYVSLHPWNRRVSNYKLRGRLVTLGTDSIRV